MSKYFYIPLYAEEGARIRTIVRPTGGFKDIAGLTFDSMQDNKLFNSVVKTMGMCLFCQDMDFSHLEEHHPDKEKLPNFKVTLCANHHRSLHWSNGSYWRYKNGRTRI